MKTLSDRKEYELKDGESRSVYHEDFFSRLADPKFYEWAATFFEGIRVYEERYLCGSDYIVIGPIKEAEEYRKFVKGNER